MKKLLAIEEGVYTPKQKDLKIEKFAELGEALAEIQEVMVDLNKEVANETKDVDLTDPTIDQTLKILVNQFKLDENCSKMKVKVNKDEFKSLFGPKAKPRKGDYLSLKKSNKKFKVTKSKKFTAKKKGKGYNLSLKSV